MNFKLRVSIAAVLESQRLEVVVAFAQPDIVDHDVAPQVAGRMLSSVDADVGTAAVVGVEAEVVRAG